MFQSNEIPKFDLLTPTEENNYCLFQQELENNPLVLFHATPKRNLNSIISNGFRSAESLGTGGLGSVSYAKRSSGCLAHMDNTAAEDLVVFAVKFEDLSQKGIRENPSDIHVDLQDIQPVILGYCEIPNGYRVT
ncbi:MAG: hypothetical protein PHE55_04680 [Methylococcaceae bacterium]|nr:hypothetical protein [Methylococcaceae bacterium]